MAGFLQQAFPLYAGADARAGLLFVEKAGCQEKLDLFSGAAAVMLYAYNGSSADRNVHAGESKSDIPPGICLFLDPVLAFSCKCCWGNKAYLEYIAKSRTYTAWADSCVHRLEAVCEYESALGNHP